MTSVLRRIAIDPVISLNPFQMSTLKQRFQVVHDWPVKSSVEGLLLHSKVSEDFIGNITGLKWIAVRAKNTDYAPSMPGIRKFGIPSLGKYAVAEHTFALILGLRKQLIASDRSVKEGHWRIGLNRELRSSTLGIIGGGTIGMQVAKMAAAFEMKVLIARSPSNPMPNQIPMEELLSASDIVTIHVPSQNNDNLITAKELQIMKPHALLINTSRGSVINEVDLQNALDKEIIAGAGLDVFNKEPPLPNSLAFHKKVLATPHMGFQTYETLEEMNEALVQTIMNEIK